MQLRLLIPLRLLIIIPSCIKAFIIIPSCPHPSTLAFDKQQWVYCLPSDAPTATSGPSPSIPYVSSSLSVPRIRRRRKRRISTQPYATAADGNDASSKPIPSSTASPSSRRSSPPPRHGSYISTPSGISLREINNKMITFGRQKDFNKVLQLLRFFETQEGLRPNTYTFNALINAAVLCHRGEEEIKRFWAQMTEIYGIRPTVVTYNIFLKRYFGRRSPLITRQALAILDEMRHEGVAPDVLTFNELINICVEGGDMNSATGLVQAMVHRGLSPDAATYTTLIKGYGLKGNLTGAFDCFHEMQLREGVSLTTYACNVLADACIRCGQPSRALKVFKDVDNNYSSVHSQQHQSISSSQQQQHHAKREEGGRGAVTSFSASQSAARGGGGEEGGGPELDARSFNIMIKAHRSMASLDGAVQALQTMKARGFEPDIITYNTLVDAYCKAQRPEGARALLQEMASKKLAIDHQTLHPLIQEEITSLAAPLDQALSIARTTLTEYGQQFTNSTICMVIEAMIDLERPRDAIEAFIVNYIENDQIPSVVAYNALIKAYRECALNIDPEGGEVVPPIRIAQFYANKPPILIEVQTPQEILQAILPIAHYLRASIGTPSFPSPSPSPLRSQPTPRQQHHNKQQQQQYQPHQSAIALHPYQQQQQHQQQHRQQPQQKDEQQQRNYKQQRQPSQSSSPSFSPSTSSSRSPSSSSSPRSSSNSIKGPDSVTYNVLMDFAAELGDLKALDMLQKERTAAGLAVDHYVIHSLMKGHATRGNLAGIIEAKEKMELPLRGHATRGNLAGVIEAKEKMELLRVQGNERTFSVLVLSLLRCGQVERAEELLRNAIIRQLYVHDSLFMAFIQHHANQRNLSAARQIFEGYKAKYRRRWSIYVWNAWLGALAIHGDLQAAEKALEEMLQVQEGQVINPLRPTMTTYSQLIRAACVAGDIGSALNYLSSMKQKRLLPDIRVYNWILYACVEKGETTALAEIVSSMEREGVQPNRITQRAKHQIMRLLASRMRFVSDTFVGRLSATLGVTTTAAKAKQPPPSSSSSSSSSSKRSEEGDGDGAEEEDEEER